MGRVAVSSKYVFHKYSGAGNDFIVFDTRMDCPALDPLLVRQLCQRHRGIGADGVMWLSESDSAHFKMVYFNADGSRGEMCGNGARCLTHFARRQWQVPESGEFEADDGNHRYSVQTDEIWVEILGRADFNLFEEGAIQAGFVNMGVPHIVWPTSQFNGSEIETISRRLNADERFPQGTNVNFVLRSGANLRVRTWERGVNAETLACGTGATAVAHFAVQQKWQDWPVVLDFPGGQLRIDSRENGYWLTGPVDLVFAGSWENASGNIPKKLGE